MYLGHGDVTKHSIQVACLLSRSATVSEDTPIVYTVISHMHQSPHPSTVRDPLEKKNGRMGGDCSFGEDLSCCHRYFCCVGNSLTGCHAAKQRNKANLGSIQREELFLTVKNI